MHAYLSFLQSQSELAKCMAVTGAFYAYFYTHE